MMQLMWFCGVPYNSCPVKWLFLTSVWDLLYDRVLGLILQNISQRNIKWQKQRLCVIDLEKSNKEADVVCCRHEGYGEWQVVQSLSLNDKSIPHTMTHLTTISGSSNLSCNRYLRCCSQASFLLSAMATSCQEQNLLRAKADKTRHRPPKTASFIDIHDRHSGRYRPDFLWCSGNWLFWQTTTVNASVGS